MKKSMENDKNDPDFQAFLSAFSHKLRNPLHSIGINLEVVRTKIRKSLGKKAGDVENHLDIMAADLSSLTQIIRGFSEIIAVVPAKKSAISAEKLIKEAVERVRMNGPKHEIMIASETEKNVTKLMVNKDQIIRALFEVLSNAIEASRERGKVFIKIRKLKDVIEISVSDQGKGVSKTVVNKAFDLFYTTKEEKRGCGLTLARRLIEVNGGEMKMKSQTNRGTTILINFKASG